MRTGLYHTYIQSIKKSPFVIAAIKTMKNILLSLAACLLLVSSTTLLESIPSSNISTMYTCFETVTALTQSCGNDNKAYMVLMGHTSGLGSEFLAYYMNSIFTSIMNNRRLIFVRSYRPWEYDCANHAAWGCYFNMGGCDGNLVDPVGIDLSKFSSYHRYPRESGSEFIARESLKLFQKSQSDQFLDSFRTVMKEAYADKYPQLANICEDATLQKQNPKNGFHVSYLAGILTNHLYQVTEEMYAYIDYANERYFQVFAQRKVPHSPLFQLPPTSYLRSSVPAGTPKNGILHHTISHSGSGSGNNHVGTGRGARHRHRPPLYHYAAVQLRLTDKKYETPAEKWPLISNMEIIAKNVLLMLQDYQKYHPQDPPLSHIYLATDDCTAAEKLVEHMLAIPVSSLKPYTRSFTEDIANATDSPATSPVYVKPDFFFIGPCFQEDGVHIDPNKRNWNPREDKRNTFADPPPSLAKYLATTLAAATSTKERPKGYIDMHQEDHRPSANTVALMADIDMLRHGAVFMGSFYSNLVRLIHYLRVPQQHHFSYHMLIDDPEFQDRNNMKPHF